VAKRGLPNVKVLPGDARPFLARHVPPASLRAVHVYFPDPWWKARHKKRRVMNDAFAKDIERTLLPGGALHFWSDVEEYFHSTLELLAAHTRLVGPLEVSERPAEHDLDYRTHFERRMRQHDLPVYRAEYRKAE
jgi:tRNA (guanine-N7-)-methyltransferase